ncbi:hypothetical protein DICVIV_13454 [Dictyocaulus viviparus]|uniref:Uncharacterized protein n=1 Tax=Dictyocaulus viviparus TaxID=29172 RepID=A0A0D8X9Z5_DICVI|nr:hypothetical protein DICVIV_13454 [Dictyocaulus viviparus]
MKQLMRLKEVLPTVQHRYEALLKQRDILVRKINILRESIDLPAYITKVIRSHNLFNNLFCSL